MWVLLSIFPELTDDNEVVEIVGCFTDIRYAMCRPKQRQNTDQKYSQQKWSEKLQATLALNAQESKRYVPPPEPAVTRLIMHRQLEKFIDTTSHEMRNPLSAIVQCADVRPCDEALHAY